MSIQANGNLNTFSFLYDKTDPTLSFPSPPPSTASDIQTCLDFESYTHCSPGNGDLDPLPVDSNLTLDLSPIATSSSLSTSSPINLITPDASIDFSEFNGGPFDSEVVDVNAAEAISNHHLSRYFHYKALAAQAEEQARACVNDFTIFCNEVMSGTAGGDTTPVYRPEQTQQANMISFQQQPNQFFSQPPAPTWNAMSFQQNQAAIHHAQAQVHMQAHDVAAARVKSISMSNQYYVPSTRSSFDASNWSHQSISTQSNSSSIPSTPNYVAPPMVKSDTAPAQIAVPSIPESDEYEGEDELPSTDEDVKPSLSQPLTNLNGGGRGYIPGQTPDDPKKRHKCHVCGRGFARAFNLKSHLQTHDPSRPKPHICPHSTCRRGFSRLHDLERHRQGIHTDGPLVDAKRHGVAPAVARAQIRMQKRAQNGSLT